MPPLSMGVVCSLPDAGLSQWSMAPNDFVGYTELFLGRPGLHRGPHPRSHTQIKEWASKGSVNREVAVK